MSTQDVLDHHLTAFGAGDAAEVAADYTDASILITPNGVLTGAASIRASFEKIFAGVFAPGTYEFTMDLTHVSGEAAYIVWHARCAAVDIVYGTDTFIVRDGTIAVHTYALKVEPR